MRVLTERRTAGRVVVNSRTLIAVAALVSVLACGSYEAVPPGKAEVVDSAGVRVVTLAGDLAGYAVPRIGLRRAFRVGREGSGTELYKVSGARFLESDRLVIANAGAPEVIIVDHTGQASHRFGDQGEGPGQFATITSVHVGTGGTIVTYDDRQGRLTEFDSAGHLLSTRRMTDPSPISDLIPLVASMDGVALAVYGDNRSFGKGGTLRRDTTPLLGFDTFSREPDTVSLWPTKLWSFGKVAMGGTRVQVGFGPDLLSAGNAGRAALADSHGTEVFVLDDNGALLMVVRWTEAAIPVTEADLSKWKEEREALLPDHLPKELRAQFLDVPHHDTQPHLRGIAVGQNGVIWIAPTSLGARGKQTWILVDGEGKTIGGVSLPAASRILDATKRWIAVLDRSDLDVEEITVYALEGLADGPPDGTGSGS
jgi:hypothetical protein